MHQRGYPSGAHSRAAASTACMLNHKRLSQHTPHSHIATPVTCCWCWPGAELRDMEEGGGLVLVPGVWQGVEPAHRHRRGEGG